MQTARTSKEFRKLWFIVVAVIAACGMPLVSAFGADKLVVKDSAGTTTKFVVTDGGLAGIGNGTPTEPVDVQADNISTNIRLTKFGGNPGAVFRAANGTTASPTPILENNALGGFVAAGYTSAGAFSGNKVGIYFQASENFTSTAQGSFLRFDTTQNGTTTKSEKMRIAGNGSVGIGTTAPTSLLDVNSNGIRIRTSRTPASSGESCNQGDMSWDAGYVYVCVAQNSWKRASLASW